MSLPRAWYWWARDPKTGKEVRFYMEPTLREPETFKEHLSAGYKNLDFTTFRYEECRGKPPVLRPIPRRYFQAGILDAVYAEIHAKQIDEQKIFAPSRTIHRGRSLLK